MKWYSRLQYLLNRFTERESVSKRKRADDCVQLFVDRLEERRVLSVSASLIAGELIVESSAGAADSVTIELINPGDPGNETILIFDNNVSTTLAIDVLDENGVSLGNDINSSLIPSGLTINLGDENDDLTLEIPSGFSGPGSPLSITVDGGDGADTVTLIDNGGTSGAAAPIDVDLRVDAELIQLGDADFQLGSVDLDLNGSLRLTTDQSLTTEGMIDIEGDLFSDGAAFDFAVDTNGNVFNIDGGLGLSGEELNNIQITASTISLGQDTFSLGNQFYNGDLLLNDDVTFNSLSAGDIVFDSIDGNGFSLSVITDSDVIFGGDATGFENLSVTNLGTTFIDTDSISALNSIQLESQVLVGTDTTLSGTGSVQITGAINSQFGEFNTLTILSPGNALPADGLGTISLAGNVGAVVNGAFGAVSLTAADKISLHDVTTQGGDLLISAEMVSTNSSYVTNGGDFAVVGNWDVQSSSNVTTAGGEIDLSAAVLFTTNPNADPEVNLNLDASGMIDGNILLGESKIPAMVMGAQLLDNVTITGGGDVEFSSGTFSLNGGFFQLDGTGKTTVDGTINVEDFEVTTVDLMIVPTALLTVSAGIDLDVTGIAEINSNLTTTGAAPGFDINIAAADIQLGADLSASGSVNITGPVTLTGDQSISSAHGATTITGDVLGDGMLQHQVTFDGETTVSGSIGGAGATIGNLIAFTGSLQAGAINISGNLSADQALKTNTGDISVGGNLTANSTVESAGGITVSGTSRLGGDVTSVADQEYQGSVTLTSDVHFSAADGGDADNNAITFLQSVDEDAGATSSNAMFTTSDNIVLTGAVGANIALDSVTIENANSVIFSSAVEIDGDLLIDSTHDVSFNSTIEIGGTLTQSAGTGTTTFNGTSGTGIGGDLLVSTENVIFAGNVVTTVGEVQVIAGGSISFTQTVSGTGGLDAGSSMITLLADIDSDNVGSFSQATDSVITTTNESTDAVTIAVLGSGNAELATIQAGTMSGVVSVSVGGAILDATPTSEGANITAFAAAIGAGMGIGAAGGVKDLNTNVDQIAFVNTAGATHIQNDGALTIQSTAGIFESQALGGGSITASSPLTIAMNTVVGGNFTFTAGDSAAIADNLVINADVTHMDGNGTIDFVAGDDIIQQSGTITNIGGTTNEVHFLADNEGAADADRGSITQAASARLIAGNVSFSAAEDVLFDQPGAPGNDVDVVAATVSGMNSRFAFSDLDGLQIGTVGTVAGITTNSGDITLETAGLLSIGDGINGQGIQAGTGIVLLNSAGVTETSGSTITASGLELLGTGTFSLAEANQINSFAANIDGELTLVDAGTLLVGTVDGNDGFAGGTDGITTNGNNVSLTTTGLLTIGDGTGQDINAGAASVVIDSAGAAEAAGSTILATNLELLGTGNFLLNETNDVDVLAAAIMGELSFVDLDELAIGTVNTTAGIATLGSNVTIQSGGELVVNQELNTQGGAGGVVSVNSAVLNAALNAGAGDITLTGGGEDLIINVDQSTATTATYAATRDVIIGATVSTTGAAANIVVSADTDNDSVGGVHLLTAGQLNSSGSVLVEGSDLSTTAMSVDSVRVDTDGANDQILAVNDITIQSRGAAPANADLIIDGFLRTTTGNIDLTSNQNVLLASNLTANTGNIDVHQAVILTGSTIFNTGGTVTFDSTVDDDGIGGTNSNLRVEAVGATRFSDAVGATNAIESLLTNGGGTTELNGDVTVDGAIQFDDAVVLTNSLGITSNDAGLLFNSTLDGSTAGTEDLTITLAAIGDLTFAQAVGQGTALGDVLIANANDVNLNGAFTADSLIQQAGTGQTTIDGVTTLNGAGGVNIRTVDVDVNQNVDVATAALGADVVLTATNDVSLDATILSGTGGVTLTAAQNITVSGGVMSTAGAVLFEAGNDVAMSATAFVTAVAGSVTVTADSNGDDNGAGGSLFMQGGALINAGTGSIQLMADEDITLGGLLTTNASIGAVEVVSTSGAILDGGDTHTEIVANTVGAVVTLTAETGIGTVGNALETQIHQLDATVNGVGGIDVSEADDLIVSKATTTNGSIDISAVGTMTINDGGAVGNAVSAGGAGDVNLSTTGTAANLFIASEVVASGGDVSISTVDGNLTITGPVSTTNLGNVVLIAGDADADGNGDLTIQSSIMTEAGSVQLTSEGNDVSFSADGDVTTVAGRVDVNAGATDDSGNITQALGSVIDAGTAQVEFNANGQITLSQIVTDNASTAAVTLNADMGVDSIDPPNVLNIDAAAGRLVVKTDSGVGPIRTTVESLDLTNMSTGSVTITETDAINIIRVEQNAAAGIDLTAGGTMTIVGGEAGVTGTSASVNLTTEGAGSEIVINSTVQSTTGKITINAADNVRMGAASGIATQAAELLIVGGDALNNASTTTGGVLMEDGATIDATDARVDLVAKQNVQVGRITTTTEVRLTSTEAAVTDAGDSGGVDVTANSLGVSAVAGVGSGDALETSVALLAASNTATGGIEVDNTSGVLLTIGEFNSTPLDVTLGPISGINLAGKIPENIVINHDEELIVAAPVLNTTGGEIDLSSGADFTVQAQIIAEINNPLGIVRLDAGADLIVLDTDPSQLNASDIEGFQVIGTAGSPVPVFDQGTGLTVYDPLNPDLFNPQETPSDPLNFDPNSSADLALLPVRFAENVIVRSNTGSITQPVPSLTNVDTPQVLSTGIATITGDFGRDAENEFTYVVDWDSDFGDETDIFNTGDPLFSHEEGMVVGTVPGVGPGDFDFDFFYSQNPNPDNPSAPILITITVRDDAGISFFADGGNVDLGVITMSSEAPVPGEGLGGAIAFDLSIEVPQLGSPRVQFTETFQGNSNDAGETEDENFTEGVVESDSGRDELILIIQKIGPDGKVEKDQFGRSVQRTLHGADALQRLNDLPGLHKRLDVGHWKIFTREGEDGQMMLVEDVLLRDGRPVVGDEGTQDRPPTAENAGEIPAKPMKEMEMNGGQEIDPQSEIDPNPKKDDGQEISLLTEDSAVPLAALGIVPLSVNSLRQSRRKLSKLKHFAGLLIGFLR